MTWVKTENGNSVNLDAAREVSLRFREKGGWEIVARFGGKPLHAQLREDSVVLFVTNDRGIAQQAMMEIDKATDALSLNSIDFTSSKL